MRRILQIWPQAADTLRAYFRHGTHLCEECWEAVGLPHWQVAVAASWWRWFGHAARLDPHKHPWRQRCDGGMVLRRERRRHFIGTCVCVTSGKMRPTPAENNKKRGIREASGMVGSRRSFRRRAEVGCYPPESARGGTLLRAGAGRCTGQGNMPRIVATPQDSPDCDVVWWWFERSRRPSRRQSSCHTAQRLTLRGVQKMWFPCSAVSPCLGEVGECASNLGLVTLRAVPPRPGSRPCEVTGRGAR